MNGHVEYLELVAASIDFGLTEKEVARLNYHLASCPECRRAAAELRGQNAAIATTPVPALAPARSEQILRASLRKQAARPRWGMLAVAALLATLAGGVALAGLRLVDNDPAPSEPPPSEVAEASVPPSTEPGASSEQPPLATPAPPPVTPDSGQSEPPDTDEVSFEFPLPYSPDVASIRLAPLADGRVWVSFRDANGTVLALLDGAGAGEPLGIPGAEDCVPLAVADGSVRLVCAYSDEEPEACVDACGEDRVFAYAPNLEELSGFPVSLPTGITGAVDRHGARVVGSDVVLGFVDSADELAAPLAHLVTVRGNGSLDEGVDVPGPYFCCAIGPEGIGFGKAVESHDDGTQTSTIFALDASGVVAGWPVQIEGTASGPGFGPAGDVYFSSWVDEGSRIVRIRDATHSLSVDLPGAITWDPAFDGPLPPLVDEVGRTWVVVEDRILSFDPTGAAVPGFPYVPETALLEQGADCPPGDTGCQGWTEPPRLAPRGLTYALESAPEGSGDRITVVNPDGAVRSGWPKTLQREGATWDSVTIGENRTAYAIAVEPEPNEQSSISILAFAPNGARQWIRTIVEPLVEGP